MPPETAAIGARAQRHLGLLEDAGRTLETALATPGLPAEAEVQLRFSLGRVRDEAGDFAAAADLFREANRRQQARFGAAAAESDLAQFARAVDRIMAAFDADRMTAAPHSGESSERPLFIVGLPRAGKSLAEQILCSHPDIHGAGELLGIPNAAEELGRVHGGWPEGIAGVTAEQLGAAAAGYLGELDRADPNARRVTDTMPFNFLHLGLIELLFPNARVVHCLRHPADLALRIYAKNFAGRSLAFASDVGHIARYLRDYRRLTAHWRASLRREVHELHYETLVREPAAATRALLDFVGLPWDERCLRFYEPGVATSASDTPVRRPLADREIGAWRHYRELLAPAIDTLEDEDFWHDPA
jgi:tetratricopeptide (TPR) repeat protein